MIRNYLGFPRGISGGDLVFRAWEQALLFGAEFVFTQRAIGLASRNGLNAVTLSGGDEVLGRAVILASGVEYRRLGVPSLDRWTGAGLFYGAAGAEARRRRRVLRNPRRERAQNERPGVRLRR